MRGSIFDEKPSRSRMPSTVDRERFMVLSVSDHQRNRFSGTGTDHNVSTTENNRGHAIGVGVGRHKMIGGSLLAA